MRPSASIRRSNSRRSVKKATTTSALPTGLALDGHIGRQVADHAGRRTDQRHRRTVQRSPASWAAACRCTRPSAVDGLVDPEGQGVLVLPGPDGEPLEVAARAPPPASSTPLGGHAHELEAASDRPPPLAGARTVISNSVLATSANPAPPRTSRAYSSSPRQNGPTGLLPGGGVRGGGTKGRSAVPVCHGLRSTPCQQAKTKRPPGPSRPRMAPKAAVGSSKNITPSWLTARSKGSCPSASGLHVA